MISESVFPSKKVKNQRGLYIYIQTHVIITKSYFSQHFLTVITLYKSPESHKIFTTKKKFGLKKIKPNKMYILFVVYVQDDFFSITNFERQYQEIYHRLNNRAVIVQCQLCINRNEDGTLDALSFFPDNSLEKPSQNYIQLYNVYLLFVLKFILI